MAAEWRTCGICHEHYEGKFGECTKCAERHRKSVKYQTWGAGTGRQRGRPTLDIQEGNGDSDNR